MIYRDFYGFTYKGVHSSSFGIVRVSGGSRYSENTLPNFQDKTATVPGADGVYHFDTQYQQKNFSILIAFDSMSELQYRNFKSFFDGKSSGDLIFDEVPYKIYSAKVQNSPQLKTICFDDKNGDRIYKGEGTINFVCFYPFARCVDKFLNLYSSEVYTNKDEWKVSTKMYESPNSISGITLDAINQTPEVSTNFYYIYVYNPGDCEADWVAIYPFSTSVISSQNIIIIFDNKISIGALPQLAQKGSDTHVCVNSKTGLIEGCILSSNVYVKTGTIYGSGENLPKIPKMNTGISVSNDVYGVFKSALKCSSFTYNYLYY